MPRLQAGRMLLLVAAFLLVETVVGRAQTTGDGGFQPYALRHTQAAEVEQALGRLLPAGSEVIADAKLNRILVRGPQATHELVRSTLESLDRPRAAEPAPTRPASAPPVLKVYTPRSGTAISAADWLRGQFHVTAGVRVAADSRTGQVLVYAPAEMQAHVAARLAQMPDLPASPAPHPAMPSASPVAAPNAAPRVAAGQSFSQVVPLRQQSAQQMEATLARSLGDRLSVVGAPQAGMYEVRLTGGGTVQFEMDRSANRVVIRGSTAAGPSLVHLIEMLDQAPAEGSPGIQLISLRTSRPTDIRRAVDAIQTANTTAVRAAASAANPVGAAATPPTAAGAKLAMMFQQRPPAAGQAVAQAQPQPLPLPQPQPQQQPGPPQENTPPNAPDTPQAKPPAQQPGPPGGLVGPVQVEVLEGLDVMVVRGNPGDVDQVMQIIQQIERLSAQTEPAIELYPLQYADGEAVGLLVSELYADVFAPRQGTVTITPLVKPNALVLVGRPENVKTALDLIKRLDQPVAPETQFQVFHLKHATAATAQGTVNEFFASRPGLGAKARVTSDFRSNSLIVQASNRDIAEIAALINKLDTQISEAVNELRVFTLEHSLASDVAVILQGAVSTSGGGVQAAGMRAGVAAAGGGAGGAVGVQVAGFRGGEEKSAMLRFVTVDAKGQKVLSSGILTGVQITTDARANSLLVSAPADCMELLGALIKELDQRPVATAQLKVFTVVNGDAQTLVTTLESLFNIGGGLQQGLIQTGARESESSLIPLRFGIDVRTNSIIASGSEGDLTVVEAVLLRLDESDARHRKSTVYRLKNAPAADVANAINQFLSYERQVEQISPGLVSAFEQIEREVVVVPETVSNSLIVSATARFYDEIQGLVEQLDKRPPMVMIQVVIAQVSLSNFNEFGIELGLQDSILFDRSTLGNLLTTSTQTSTSSGIITQQNIVSATNTPGFAFNNSALGNSGSASSLANASATGGQGLSSFGVNRSNSSLGYGGLVLSASSENISMLIRALQQCHKLEVLSRPQVMTLDNQPAYVQVGQRVPYINSASITTAGNQINTVQLQNVGIILGVTPRISPDGLVVMEIDAEKSQTGPESEGVPISVLTNGQVIRAPRIETTTAQTTVSAMDGQTVVLGGLITKSKETTSRRVPYLSDIPILGNLFKYDSKDDQRDELLIIMTPTIVKSEDDIDKLRRTEAARMSWCLADVIALQGDIGVRGRYDHWHDSETTVVYPDVEPGAPAPGAGPGVPPAVKPESIPTPPHAAPLPGGVRVDDKVPSLVPPQSGPADPIKESEMRRAADPQSQWFPPAGFDSSVMPAAYRPPQR
jgi:type II secretion system protein D